MRRAFTIIELLIVIGIIGLLAAMIVVVSKRGRDLANESLTRSRMEAVLQGILAYQSDGSLAMTLQVGPLSASTDIVNGYAKSNDWSTVYGMAAPTSASYFWDSPYGSAMTPKIAGVSVVKEFAVPANKYTDRLSNFNPQKTIELLTASGVMVDARTNTRFSDPALQDGTDFSRASYLLFNDRSKRMVWNDAWGNPLIVAYAVYQTQTNGDATKLADEVRAYGFNRAVYISVAAIGPKKLASINYTGSWVGGSGVFQSAWDMVNSIVNCKNGDGTLPSNELYKWGNRPWGGITKANGSLSYAGLTSYLSAPQEIK